MTVDHLWATWRSSYIEGSSEPASEDGCVFCALFDLDAPASETHIVWRSDLVVAILNAYPYTSGHLLVMPRRHAGGLDELAPEERTALWASVESAVAAVTTAYEPGGVNLGANLGKAAGAGVPGHLHVHVLPRWHGDTNFMTTVASTRVLPEGLDVTWRKLTAAWVPPM